MNLSGSCPPEQNNPRNENTMIQAAFCVTVQTCVAVCGLVLTRAMLSATGYARVAAYTAQYGSIMPQYIESAPAQIQALPMVAAMAVVALAAGSRAAGSSAEHLGHTFPRYIYA